MYQKGLRVPIRGLSLSFFATNFQFGTFFKWTLMLGSPCLKMSNLYDIRVGSQHVLREIDLSIYNLNFCPNRGVCIFACC